MNCVKHVAMQRWHIAQWHNGLKCTGKAGMPVRTTSLQDDPTWRTNNSTPCFPSGYCIKRYVQVSCTEDVACNCCSTTIQLRERIKMNKKWNNVYILNCYSTQKLDHLLLDHRCGLGVAPLLLTQPARVRWSVGSVSWLRYLRGFSSTVRQMSGNLRYIRPRVSFDIINQSNKQTNLRLQR